MAGGMLARIVVADGDDEVRRLLRVKLGGAGFDVVEAGSLVEVRAAARCQAPDVLLCEGRLADGDAYELFGQLRAGPGGDRLVIVVLAELETDGDIHAALAAGADDVVAKPFSPSEVILRIRVGLARRDLTAGDLAAGDLAAGDPAAGDPAADRGAVDPGRGEAGSGG